MRAVAVLDLVLCLGGCASVEWHGGSPRESWRGATIRCADAARVAARSEDAAADAYRGYDAVLVAIAAVCDAAPEAPLLLVTDAEDEPLLGDPVRTMERITTWHQEHVAVHQSGTSTSTRPDVPNEVIAALARITSGAVPLEASELGLPQTWREGVTWCCAMPTDAAIESAADTAIDHGLDKADLSFLKRALLAPLIPIVRSMARAELRREVQRHVLQ